MKLWGGGEKKRGAKIRTSKANLTYYRSGSTKSASPFSSPTSRSNVWHKFLVRFIDGVIIIVILFCLVYSLLVQPDPRMRISSNAYRPVSTYQAEATKELGAIKNRTKLSLDEQGIIKSLQAKFPEISSGTIELPLFSEKPTIHLNIAPPSFFLDSNGKSYIVDADGVAIAQSSDMKNIRNLPVITDQSGFSTQIGKQILSSSGISFIKTIIAECEHNKVKISSIILPKTAQEVYIRPAAGKYFVKLYLGGEPLQQIGQFAATKHYLDTHNIRPSQYIDARVPGKIFYK